MLSKAGTVLLVVTLAALVGCQTQQATPTPTPTSEPTPEGRAIVLGDISDDPAETIEEVQPLADYLVAKLSEYGITEGRVKVAGSMDEMTQLLKSGEVDLYFDSVYPATIVSDQSGSQLFLRRWRGGVSEYHTVLFARKDSGITTLDDLKGRMIAFEEEFSTSGYMLPLVYLVEHGINPIAEYKPDAAVAGDEVGYVFSGDDDNNVQWVVSGRVAASVLDNGKFAKLEQSVRDQFVILAETEKLPRQVGVARPGLDPELLTAITKVLTAAHENPDGQKALETFSETARFDEFPQGLEQAVGRMRKMLEIVRQEQ